MPRRAAPLALVAVASLLAACREPVPREPEQPFSPATRQYLSEAFMMGSGGAYGREGPRAGALAIERQDDGQWLVTVRSAGATDRAATVADCELVAVGPFVEGTITARLTPFESDLGGLSAEDLGDDPPRIIVRTTPDGATVSDDERAAERYCPPRSDITGRYVKKAG